MNRATSFHTFSAMISSVGEERSAVQTPRCRRTIWPARSALAKVGLDATSLKKMLRGAVGHLGARVDGIVYRFLPRECEVYTFQG